MPSHYNIFKKYINNNFIETGTFKGEGVDVALSVGFKFVDSIEIFEEFYIKAKKKFLNNENVKIHLGSSESKLWEVISTKNEKLTFWLDAHYSGPISDPFQETHIKTGTPMSNLKTPLLIELEIISNHPIKNHIIMIDDMRCCGTEYFNFISRSQIEESIYKINNNYKIIYEDSWEKKDILVAIL